VFRTISLQCQQTFFSGRQADLLNSDTEPFDEDGADRYSHQELQQREAPAARVKNDSLAFLLRVQVEDRTGWPSLPWLTDQFDKNLTEEKNSIRVAIV